MGRFAHQFPINPEHEISVENRVKVNIKGVWSHFYQNSREEIQPRWIKGASEAIPGPPRTA